MFPATPKWASKQANRTDRDNGEMVAEEVAPHYRCTKCLKVYAQLSTGHRTDCCNCLAIAVKADHVHIQHLNGVITHHNEWVPL